MDVNKLDRIPSYSYRVNAKKIDQRSQKADKNNAGNRQGGDTATISEEGRNALKEKMSVVKRLEKTGEIRKLSSVSSYGLLNDFEKIMSELGSGSVSDDFVTKDYSQAEVDALKARFEKEEGPSTQIWSELKDFHARINYHSSGTKTEESTAKKQNADIKEQAYNAFMSAINEKNSGLLKQEKGSLNHFWLDLGISSSARDFLNSIWDYHANLKR